MSASTHTDPVTALLRKMGCKILSVSGHPRSIIRVAATPAVKQLDGIPVGFGCAGVHYNAPFHGCDVEWTAPRLSS